MIKTQIDLDFREDLERFLKKKYKECYDFRILSKALDARNISKDRAPRFNYSVEIRTSADERFSCEKLQLAKINFDPSRQQRPIIIGAGPAGLFAALRLIEQGIPSILFERGEELQKRILSMARYWRYGELNPESNVEYGAGGAGLFSDGKLFTRVKSPYIGYVLQKLVEFGAPPETLYLKDAHLGSNLMRRIMQNLLSYLCQHQVEIHYNTKVKQILTSDSRAIGVECADGKRHYSSAIILASGHSAREIYEELCHKEVAMKPKPFAIGVRIEHKRSYIDQLQLGRFAGDPRLGAANYRFTHHCKQSERGTYTFCMCPGGVIVPAATSKAELVINGMSNQGRNGHFSNAAIVVAVKESDFCDSSSSPLAGMLFQQKIEAEAFATAHEFAPKASSRPKIPGMSIESFLHSSKKTKSRKLLPSSCPGEVVASDFATIFPPFVLSHLQKALLEWERITPGFAKEATLLAPETRTSAPVTIIRHLETLESTSHQGLYPCGEGAGYAGGITSAAVDGVNVALSILSKEFGCHSGDCK
ncbi:MAG: hypothetical protein HQK52_09490 [Oligoflexia bacterium]|nr:hypothetical protein [Oligoflexia bacterium]